MSPRPPELDLDELRALWQARDARMETLLATTVRLARTDAVGRLTARLQRLTRSLALGVAGLVPTILLLGGFLAAHASEPRFLAPGLLVHLAAIMLLVALVRQLVLLRRLTPAAPVVALQRAAEQLRLERIRTSVVALAAGPLLWLPVVIVLARSWLDVDLYAVASGAWIVANLAFGVAVIAVTLVATARHRRRPEPERRAHPLLVLLSGEEEADIRVFLDELAALEADRPPTGDPEAI